MRKKAFIIIMTIIGLFVLIGCQSIEEVNARNQKKFAKSFVDNLSKKNIDECEMLIYGNGLSPDYIIDDGSGETIYNRAINVVLKESNLDDYVSLFRDMKDKGFNKNAVKINNEDSLSDNQKSFLKNIEFYGKETISISKGATANTEQKAQEVTTITYEPQKIVDSNGKQIWKIYIPNATFHFQATYNGNGNFIVQLSDSNQNLVEVIANEIGDYVSDKTVIVPYQGWYYLEVHISEGSWKGNWQ